MAGQKNKKTDSDWLNLSSEFEKITESRGEGEKRKSIFYQQIHNIRKK